MSKTELNLRTINYSLASEPLGLWIERFITDRRAGGAASGTVYFYTEKLKVFHAFSTAQAVDTIEQITPDVLRAFLRWLEDTGHNPGGRHSFYRAVRAFMIWVWTELDLTSPNPIKKVRAPKVAIEPLEPVSPETVKAMLDTCDTSTMAGARDKALLLFLLDTGARMSEAMAVEIHEVDPGGAVLIRQGKGRKPRTVYIGRTTRRALRAYLKFRGIQPGALWLTISGEPLTKSGLVSMLRRRADYAGVEAPTPHEFRRAFALAMLRAGVDILSLQRLLGHSSLAVLQRYVKQTDLDGQRAHDKGSPVESL